MKNEPHCINKNDLLERTKQDIAQFGLQVISVTSTDYLPSFSYSIGLTQTYQHPEIICFGLPSSLGHEIINDIASMLKNGTIFEEGKMYTDIFQDSRATFLSVDASNLEYYFGAGLNYYQDKAFEALIARNKWELRKEIQKYSGRIINGVEITESGLVAAAHLGGAGSVKKYLKSNGRNGFKDGFGTSLSSYIRKFSNYDISHIEADANAKVDLE